MRALLKLSISMLYSLTEVTPSRYALQGMRFKVCAPPQDIKEKLILDLHKMQGSNARKVISEMYASFVLQCTVSGRQCKHKTDVEA